MPVIRSDPLQPAVVVDATKISHHESRTFLSRLLLGPCKESVRDTLFCFPPSSFFFWQGLPDVYLSFPILI
ncbi:hypothetical protein I7I53_05172 [Histoplasma capsulatum var. duboisii H88]|uniref:Uncharacterized protein n=1 Tax=Ajellomyces capsulatus (strain H88) TaxID=544711 RepID=A0A8A1LS15_AJEC8|nr:hypothetical protein I7I53_05172 [Histoplasma capsulatum var. duboisii H88]